eukprot:3792453-Amphidinium_carterae.1
MSSDRGALSYVPRIPLNVWCSNIWGVQLRLCWSKWCQSRDGSCAVCLGCHCDFPFGASW